MRLIMYIWWLCMQCCEVTLWTGVSMLLLPCVGGVHTDLYSSCTLTDSSSSSSASVWGRAQRGNLHLLSLSACFYHRWGNASLPDLTVSELCCVGKKSDRALRKHTEEINGDLRSAAQHIIWKQEENPTPFPDRPCIPAWVDVQWRSRMLLWVSTWTVNSLRHLSCTCFMDRFMESQPGVFSPKSQSHPKLEA